MNMPTSAYFKGVNIMTPEILYYERTNLYAIEVSRGSGFRGSVLYGVTVANLKTGESEPDLSKCFESMKEATAHINRIKRIRS